MRLRDLIQRRELLYPSNMLTIARLALVPLTLNYLGRPERRRAALICLAVTMLTDAIDGPIARARGEVSRLGEILDPIADKLLLDGAALILTRTRGFPWWVTALLLFRDVGIVAAALPQPPHARPERRQGHHCAAHSGSPPLPRRRPAQRPPRPGPGNGPLRPLLHPVWPPLPRSHAQ
jgi:CDP-alcohol phosphatidyltransferase